MMLAHHSWEQLRSAATPLEEWGAAALGELRLGTSGRLELVDPLLGRWVANGARRRPFGV